MRGGLRVSSPNVGGGGHVSACEVPLRLAALSTSPMLGEEKRARFKFPLSSLCVSEPSNAESLQHPISEKIVFREQPR
jgi:hypothetical protein